MLESMAPTFEQKGDVMHKEWFKTRTKFIHSVGAIGKVRFVPVQNQFTGLFQGA